MQHKPVRLGTRGSALAIAQSEWVASKLRKAYPDVEIEIVPIVTGGDRSQATETPLSSYSEKGIFAKEIEQALLADEIDLAVHSMKDLAATLPSGLVIAAVPQRVDVRDVLVGVKLADLPSGARVGTGSARRRALLSQLRPDLQLLEIRGNIDTRIAKLKNGGYDSIVLAAAGLLRLGHASVIAEYMDPYSFVPDPGQGALAIQARDDDLSTLTLCEGLNDPAEFTCVRAERAFLRALGGGCTSPVGAWARLITGKTNGGSTGLAITGMRANNVGQIVRSTISGDSSEPEELGSRLADLVAAG